MVSEITKSQDSIFCSRSQLTALRRLSYGSQDIAFSPFDDHWKQRRRLCNTELLSLAKVQSFGAIRMEEVNTLVNTITEACSRKAAVNLSETLHTFTLNNIFQVVFGKKIFVDGERESSQVSIIREMFCMMAELGAGDLFPSMGWIDFLTLWRWKLDRCFQKMDSLLDKEIRERMMMKSGGNQGSSQEHCFLDTLHLHAAEEEDQHLTMDEIKAILMDMFVAGGDTTSTSMEWGMTQLMKNPSAMKKAQAEVRRVIGDKGKVEERDLQHLHYLKMVIKESLRLHPPLPFPPPRECMEDTKVTGYDIPAKTRVYVSIWSAGRDPKYWGDDAEKFRPERFENSVVNFKGTHQNFVPFGAGRRICPGLSFAMANIEILYANLLHVFDWALPDGMAKEDIDMSMNFGIVITKKEPLVLVPSLPTPSTLLAIMSQPPAA